jgi:hypothetical protein
MHIPSKPLTSKIIAHEIPHFWLCVLAIIQLAKMEIVAGHGTVIGELGFCVFVFFRP